MPAAGQSEEEVFAELAAHTGECDACALALCLAMGVPRPDAEVRFGARGLENGVLFDPCEGAPVAAKP